MQAVPAQTLTLPLEFVVLGKPLSHQTKSKEALGKWKVKVYEAAREAASGRTPVGASVQVIITHFYLADEWESGVPDNDNIGLAITKPIRDAFNKLIYFDDRQISDFTCKSRSLNGLFQVRGLTEALARGFRSKEEFLHIVVQEAPDHSLLNSL
jgi:Holliday junction resolvase RusA-like endonuclease